MGPNSDLLTKEVGGHDKVVQLSTSDAEMDAHEVLSPYLEQFRQRPHMASPILGTKNKDPEKENQKPALEVKLAPDADLTTDARMKEFIGHHDPTSVAVRPMGGREFETTCPMPSEMIAASTRTPRTQSGTTPASGPKMNKHIAAHLRVTPASDSTQSNDHSAEPTRKGDRLIKMNKQHLWPRPPGA